MVRVADGSQVLTTTRTSFVLNLGKHRSEIKSAYVLPTLGPGTTALLGRSWMMQTGCCIGFEETRLRASFKIAKKHKRRVAVELYSTRLESEPLSIKELVAYTLARIEFFDTAQRKTPGVLSNRALKKFIRKSKQKLNCFEVLVTSVDQDDDAFTIRVTAAQANTVQQTKHERIISGCETDFKKVFAPADKISDLRADTPFVCPLTEAASPQFSRGHRLSPAELLEVQNQVKDLLAKGYISPSSSPWGAPVLFIAKPDGSWRMAIDYRKLNKVTVPNRYPLPRIDDLFDSVRGASVFSNLDLRNAYHNIRLHDSDVPKTAFITPMGLYEFKVLPFGLANAPSAFTKVMNTVFRDLIGKFVVIYLDDILIYSSNDEEHEKHIRIVLQRLEDNHLFLKREKCFFYRPEVKYLGHVLSGEGVRVNETKVKAVADWPTPTSSKEVQQFLGLSNFFRKFIQGYSTLAAPLIQISNLTDRPAPISPKLKPPGLTKSPTVTPSPKPLGKRQAGLKGPAFQNVWTQACQEAFLGIKESLTKAPLLAHPDPAKDYRAVTDASVVGTGGVLMQDGRPIAYHSHKFSSAERNYSTGEQELLAVYLALKEWRCYLEGCTGKFELDTDHEPLVYLANQPMLSRKQARYLEFFSRFTNMKWAHIAGRTNVADPLSRNPAFSEATALFIQRLSANDPLHMREIAPDILHGYTEDLWFDNPHNTKYLSKRADGFWVGTGKSIRAASESQIVVPNGNSLKARILFAFHDTQRSGHGGIDRTFRSVARYYWWPAMRLDVVDYVRHCDSCQRVKISHQNPQGNLQPLSIPTAPFDSLSMDFIVGLPKSNGFDQIYVIVDRLTKMVKLIPCKTTDDAEKIATLFHERVLSEQGHPLSIISDRDVKFTSKFWQTLLTLCAIRPGMSTAFHPQTDGQTERMNSVLEDTLRHFSSANQKNWASLLPNAQFAINNSYNRSIRDFPFRLLYGRYPRVALQPSDDVIATAHQPALSWVEHMNNAYDTAKAALKSAKDRQKTYADLHRRPVKYTHGQEVLLNSKNIKYWPGMTRKLMPRFVGPYEISHTIQKRGETIAVTLSLPEGWKIHPTFHVSLVKEYLSDGTGFIRPNPELLRTCGEPIYEISNVVDHKIQSGTVYYYVQWLHSDHVHSWELEEELLPMCSEQIDLYWRQHPSRVRPVIGANDPKPKTVKKPTHRDYATVTPDEFLIRKSTRLQEKARAREGGIVVDNDPPTELPRGGDDFPTDDERLL